MYLCLCSFIKLCLILSNHSSGHGILQARILEQVAISFFLLPSSGDLPDPGIIPTSLHWQADSVPLSHLGGPHNPKLLSKKKEGTVDKHNNLDES